MSLPRKYCWPTKQVVPSLKEQKRQRAWKMCSDSRTLSCSRQNGLCICVHGVCVCVYVNMCKNIRDVLKSRTHPSFLIATGQSRKEGCFPRAAKGSSFSSERTRWLEASQAKATNTLSIHTGILLSPARGWRGVAGTKHPVLLRSGWVCVFFHLSSYRENEDFL